MGFYKNNYKKIRTTYHFNNYGPIFLKFSKILSSINNIETDIILNAAMDRQKSAKVRYDLTTNIFNKTIPKDTAYIIDNIGHLIHLKQQILKNENYGFFFRDGLMVMLPNHKDLMTKNDIDYFKNINPVKIDINKKYNLYFKDELLGFGWSHNLKKRGLVRGGKIVLSFSPSENIKNNLNFNLDFEAYNNNNNLNYGIKIYFNEICKKNLI